MKPEKDNNTPIEVVLIPKCWKPDCKEIATGQDGSGWEWCEAHFDQEKTGSILHIKMKSYDVEFYRERIAKAVEHLSTNPHSGLK